MFAIVIIILSVPVSHLVFKYKPVLFDYKYPALLIMIFFLTLICCTKIILSNGKDVAQITNLFLEGRVTHAEELDKSGEGNPHYETYYQFVPANGNETASLIMWWSIFILCTGIIFIHYHYVRTAQKLLPEKKSK